MYVGSRVTGKRNKNYGWTKLSQSGLCYMRDTKAALQNLKPRFRSSFTESKASIIEQGHWGVQGQEEKVAAAFWHAKRLQSYMGNVCLFSSYLGMSINL